jgi:phosphatidate cytidylyltransferase
MLRKRVVTALWGIALLMAAAWFSRPEYAFPFFTILAAIWGALAVFEFYRMTGVARAWPLTGFGIVWTVLFILNPHLGFPIPLVLTSGVVLSLILLVLSPQREGAFHSWAWMVAGVLYAGWLLGYLVALRLEAGRGWVFLALLATFGSDTAAFFVGRALGRHKLAPHISPGKTWEGAIAGVFGAIIVTMVVAVLFHLSLSYGQMIILGIAVSVFGQFGDLAESLLKRNVGAKDSGNMMPGHGGLLDRMDSVVLAGVAVYLYYIFVVP